MGREHDTGGAEGNLSGCCGQIADVDHRLENLRNIAVFRIEEWYISHPKCSETQSFSVLRHFDVIGHSRSRLAAVGLERQDQTNRQLIRLEYALKSGMEVKFDRGLGARFDVLRCQMRSIHLRRIQAIAMHAV
ncbi:hypothetical protein D3C86_1288290 [compost metagenome]